MRQLASCYLGRAAVMSRSRPRRRERHVDNAARAHPTRHFPNSKVQDVAWSPPPARPKPLKKKHSVSAWGDADNTQALQRSQERQRLATLPTSPMATTRGPGLTNGISNNRSRSASAVGHRRSNSRSRGTVPANWGANTTFTLHDGRRTQATQAFANLVGDEASPTRGGPSSDHSGRRRVKKTVLRRTRGAKPAVSPSLPHSGVVQARHGSVGSAFTFHEVPQSRPSTSGSGGVNSGTGVLQTHNQRAAKSGTLDPMAEAEHETDTEVSSTWLRDAINSSPGLDDVSLPPNSPTHASSGSPEPQSPKLPKMGASYSVQGRPDGSRVEATRVVKWPQDYMDASPPSTNRPAVYVEPPPRQGPGARPRSPLTAAAGQYADRVGLAPIRPRASSAASPTRWKAPVGTDRGAGHGTARSSAGGSTNRSQAGSTLLAQQISARRGLPTLGLPPGDGSLDISFRTDAPSIAGGRRRGSLSSVALSTTGGRPVNERPPGQAPKPDTAIAPEFHLLRREVQLPHGEALSGDWGYNAEERMWERMEFPARVPAGRRDAVLLNKWLTTVLKDLDSHTQEALAVARAEKALDNGDDAVVGDASDDDVALTAAADRMEQQRLALLARLRAVRGQALDRGMQLFSSCFAEATRQVSVHCVERGELLARVWRGTRALWREVVTLIREGSAVALEQTRKRAERAAAELAMLQASVDEQVRLWQEKYDLAAAGLRDTQERCDVLTREAKQNMSEGRRLREMMRQMLALQMGQGTGGGAFGADTTGTAGANMMAEMMAAAFGGEVGANTGLQVLRLRMQHAPVRVFDVHTKLVLRTDARKSLVINEYFEVGAGVDGMGSDSDDDMEAALEEVAEGRYDPIAAAAAAANRPRKSAADRHQGPRVEGGGRAMENPDKENVFDLGVECLRFPDVLDFMFTGQILLSEMDAVQELREDAETLQMAALEAACTEKINVLREQEEEAKRAAGQAKKDVKTLQAEVHQPLGASACALV